MSYDLHSFQLTIKLQTKLSNPKSFLSPILLMPKSKRFLNAIINPFLHKSKAEDRKEDMKDEEFEAVASREQKIFRYHTLVEATSNFDLIHKLGEGGFGPVFKGRLGDGREVAVKRLAEVSRQGEEEFANEAKLLASVQHKNVVNLFGYCTHNDERMLVYEYLPNNSLDKLLFSGENKRKKLDWKTRYDIIIGVARGILYLHEDAHTRIIHRDIKASNVLLDQHNVPKIADFGMGRLYPDNISYMNTRIVGTSGYMAPEYLIHGKLSTKADVYSFGVLMLELVSGRKNTASSPLPDPKSSSVLEWAYKLYKKDHSLEMMDPVLNSSADIEQVAMCIHIALLCTQADHKLRPDMKKVVLILSKKPTALEEPMKPGLTVTKFHQGSQGGSHVTYSKESSSSGITYTSNAASSSGTTYTSASSSSTASSNN